MTSPVVIDGAQLTARQVVEVARFGAPVRLADAAAERMQQAREVVERAVARGDRVYGVTTSVGAKTGQPLAPERVGEFNRRLLQTHHVGHGPVAAPDAVRAMLLLLLNAMAAGRLGVRPLLAHRVVEALNAGRQFRVHVWGSMGESDMSAVADLCTELYRDTELAAGEAIGLLNTSPLTLGIAAMAMDDLGRLLDAWTQAAALSMEGFAANPSILSPAAVRSRPFGGLQRAAALMAAQLGGSYLLQPGGPRHLQDPLSFRSLPITFGNAYDGFAFADSQLAIEWNASQNNPVVSIEDDAMVAVANFDTLSVSMALDVARLAFCPLVTGSTERVAKLGDSFWSGLDVGLIERDEVGLPGFNGLAAFHKSITSEARLLCAPVVGELPSSSHSNGNMDRLSLSCLAARRTAELAQLCKSMLAIELLVAAQAVQMRKASPLGSGTAALFAFVRSVVPYAAGSQGVPNPAPLVAALEEREFRLG